MNAIEQLVFRAVSATLLLCLASSWAVAAEYPNIILCMGDDHGWEETGYNGHAHLHTPVLDEMAATGLRLDRFYSGHPSCSPTRGSVLTGRHPNRYGTFAPGWSIRPEEITIAQILHQAGYTCGHFGKWHLGPVKAESPTNPGAMGFDQWVSHDNFFELNPYFSRDGGPPQQYPGESSALVVDETIRFIDQAKRSGKPFFSVVWFGSPHEPYSGLPQDLALYDDLPEEYQQHMVSLTSNETGRQVRRPLREVLRERFAEITGMDRAMGTLRQYLKDAGLRENTLVWYCGDNGTPTSGLATSPYRGAKGQVYEGGIRVPGVVEWPAGIAEPRVSDVITVTSDMLPTICSLTGQALPDRPLDGVDLKSLFDGQMTERPSPLFFWMADTRDEENNPPYIDPELQKGTTPLAKLMGGIPTRNFVNYHHPNITEQDFTGDRVILGNRYKLVVIGREGNSTSKELFDLVSDPAETQNLLQQKPEIALQMEQQLSDWQRSVLGSLTGQDYILRKSIPPITEPPCSYCSTQHLKSLIDNDDRVIAWLRASHNGGAFPIRHFLAGPRVVNDTYGLFFYDPDSNFVAAYEKDYGYKLYGTRNGVMIVEGKDGTLWSALTGKAISGAQAGNQLKRIPNLTTNWDYWLMLHPESTTYDLFDGKKYPVTELPKALSEEVASTLGKVDDRLHATSMVLGVESSSGVKAYSLDGRPARACLLDEIGDQPIAVFWYDATATAVAFDRRVDGRTLTFFADTISPESAPFKDKETGTRWSVAGRGIDGPLRGKELNWVNSIQCRWYAWSAEYPKTLIYENK